MATRKPAQPIQASLTVEQMKRGISRIERLITDIEAFDSSKLTKRWGPEQAALEASIEGTLTSVFGHETVEYRRYSAATRLDNGHINMSYGGPNHDNGHEARQFVAEGKVKAVQLLNSAIKWLRDEIGDNATDLAAAIPIATDRGQSLKIFIVHGHDDVARLSMARFIESIGLEAIILSEQANQGRTIIEKIEAHGDVGFAVVLLTPDDVGGKTPDNLRSRARQNVLLELGYFMSRLGRKRVCAFAKGDLEIPTDFAGVVWEQLDDSGAWKAALARELKAAGYSIDWNKVMG